jgi:preprotein translocase subunit SecG
MYTVFAILIIITSILLVLVVLVQNPKGGGLSSSFGGGAGNQIMGAKKTTDFLEKATWTLAIALIVLSLASFAIPRQNTDEPTDMKAQEQIDDAVIPNLPAAPTAPAAE